MNTPQTKPHIRDYLILAAAILGISFAVPLIKTALNHGASIFATAFWRILLGALIVIPIGKPWEIKASKKTWFVAVVAGVFMALHFITWFASFERVSATVSVVLVTTTPVWVVLMDALFFRTKTTKMVLLGVFIAMAGATVVALTGGVDGQSTWMGSTFSLVAAMFAAYYMLLSRNAQKEMTSWQVVSVIFPVSALAILVASPFVGQPLTGHDTTAWIAVLSMGILSQTMGHAGLNLAIARLSATTSATAVLFEPVGASILMYIFYGEVVGIYVYLGAVLVIFGVWLTSIGRRRVNASKSQSA